MKKNLFQNNITRRGFIKDAVMALAATSSISLFDRSLYAAEAVKPLPSFGKAKAVIQLWLWGGPSQIDTFDPKPAAGYDYCGPYANPINTNVDGIIIGQMLPELAKCAHKYAILRGVSHRQNAHETASYLTQTGRMPGRYVYPCAGAVVSKFMGVDVGYSKMIPPYIVMTQPQGRFSESGFLGALQAVCHGRRPRAHSVRGRGDRRARHNPREAAGTQKNSRRKRHFRQGARQERVPKAERRRGGAGVQPRTRRFRKSFRHI